MSENTYELLYFRFFGLADLPRLILDVSGARYTNVFASGETMKATLKPQQRFGHLPRLTIRSPDGNEKHLWESRAINEYVADVFGLLPSDAFARADAMSFIHSLNEVFDRLAGMGVFPDLEDRRAFWTQLKTFRVHQTLDAHEKYLASKSVDGPFYYGEKYMFPDLALYILWLRLEPVFGPGEIINAERTPNILKLIQACDASKPGEYARERRDFGAAKWNSEQLKMDYDWS